MRQVKEVRTSRLLVVYTVQPPLYLSAQRGRQLSDTLVDEFPQLLGSPLIAEDQFVTLLRTASPDRLPEPVCQIATDSVQVALQNPSQADMKQLLPLLRRVYDLVREIYHVQRVCRAGRVHNKGYVIADEGEDARKIVRDCLTKLTSEQATDCQVQFSRRDGPYNVNLSVVPASTSGSKADVELPVHDVLLTGSDVNNWDISGDVPWDKVEEILTRGAQHADEEVPQFLREQLGVDAPS